MTSLLRSRQRAQELDARVEGRVAGRVDGAARPDDEMDRLVGVVATLRRTAAEDPAIPREAFAADLRARLMTEAAHALTPQAASLRLPARPRTSTRRDRRLVAVATATILLGGTAGMAAAAEHALPGEALYPVKRGIERVETRLSGSDAGRGRDLLDQASGRLAEVRGLLDENAADADLRVPGHPGGVHQPGPRGRGPAAGLLRGDRRPRRRPRGPVVRGHAAAHPRRAPRGRPVRCAGLRCGTRCWRWAASTAGPTGSAGPAATSPRSTCPPPSWSPPRRSGPSTRPARTRLDNSHRVLVPRDLLRANRQPSGRSLREAPHDDRRPRRAPDRWDARRPAGADTALRGSPAREPAHQAPRLPAVSDLPSLPARRCRRRRCRTRRCPSPSLPDPSLSVPSLPVTGDGNLGAGLGDTVDTLVPDAEDQLP